MPAVLLLLIVSAIWGCDKNGNPGTPDGNDTLNIPEAPAEKVLRSDLNHPWEILWGKDNFIWMTERQGKISKINPADGKTVFSYQVPDVVPRGEEGLLGMVQDRKFSENGFIYVVYNYNGGNGYSEKVVRFTFNTNQLSDSKTLIENIPASNIHNGSRLWITEDQLPYIFITTGDAASSGNAQQLNSLSGKILRIHADGSIPADNPLQFVCL